MAGKKILLFGYKGCLVDDNLTSILLCVMNFLEGNKEGVRKNSSFLVKR